MLSISQKIIWPQKDWNAYIYTMQAPDRKVQRAGPKQASLVISEPQVN